MVPRRAAAGEPVQHEREDGGGQHQARGHEWIDRGNHHDRADHRDARRQHVPRRCVLGGIDRIRCCRDPAREHAGLFLGEVGGRVAAEIRKQVAPQIARHRDESVRADPAADPPQHVVGGDQADQDHEGGPERTGMAAALAEHVDQMLDGVLRGERAANSGQHAGQHDGVSDRMTADVTKQERKRAMRIAR